MAIRPDALLDTIVRHIAQVAGIRRIMPGTEDVIEAMSRSGERIDGVWLYEPTAIETSIDDLNAHRMSIRLDLVGVWSSVCDIQMMGRIMRHAIATCRAIQLSGLPVDIDLLEISGECRIEQRYGMTTVVIPLTATAVVEEV